MSRGFFIALKRRASGILPDELNEKWDYRQDVGNTLKIYE